MTPTTPHTNLTVTFTGRNLGEVLTHIATFVTPLSSTAVENVEANRTSRPVTPRTKNAKTTTAPKKVVAEEDDEEEFEIPESDDEENDVPGGSDDEEESSDDEDAERPTIKDVFAAARKVSEKGKAGEERIRKLYKKFKVGNLHALEEDQYADFLKALKSK